MYIILTLHVHLTLKNIYDRTFFFRILTVILKMITLQQGFLIGGPRAKSGPL